MTSIYDILGFTSQPNVPRYEADGLAKLHQVLDGAQNELFAMSQTGDTLSRAFTAHTSRMLATHSERSRKLLGTMSAVMVSLRESQGANRLADDLQNYVRDSGERTVLTLDTLRKRGDIFLAHEAEECPPVLDYHYETVMDGKDLPYPCNYMLLKITPPEGIEVKDWKRPYIIIDPRAGHGPGIGGFKQDSQVGVALRDGHPVYFVAFRRMPEKGQYLSYVTRAEAAFVREVMRRHPDAPKPAIVGNCQGGWATLLLAATNADLTGPIVINGAPVATWAGEVGENPMRYTAGITGGTWIPMFLSDIGGGLFDGAHLVQNFEQLNPARTLFRKYTDLYRDIDKGEDRFLEFEKWWGGLFLMNEPEIRWIVEQLFVGNRLVKNEARIEPGRHIDLKAIRAPIIVFASHGDNITPPQQALNWIAETYADVSEIRIRGQRIIYMAHDQVGHLGIFVSSQIANREHTEVASTLKTIEALAPGLYEMHIENIQDKDGHKHFTVGFTERTLDDIRALDDGLSDERPFAAVARASEIQAQAYEMWVRPLLQAAVTETSADMGRAMHPQRLQRALMSSRNPAVAPVEALAAKVRQDRHKAPAGNPFIAAEELAFDAIEQVIDFWRDQRDMMLELWFNSIWGMPWMRAFGRSHEARRTLKNNSELRSLPEVSAALINIERGGFPEAVIRMLILLADNRGSVRRDRLERSSKVLTKDEPFRSLAPDRRAMIIHEQTIIASFAREEAVSSLPVLLPSAADRKRAVDAVQFIAGPIGEMAPTTLEMLQRFHAVLDLGPVTGDILNDPLLDGMADTPPAPQSSPTRRPRAAAAVKAGLRKRAPANKGTRR
jgi:pimeloyl-ACP methyl ester carboxylesterase